MSVLISTASVCIIVVTGCSWVTGKVNGLITEHSAECDDGMPPESTIAFKSQTPLRHRLLKICKAP